MKKLLLLITLLALLLVGCAKEVDTSTSENTYLAMDSFASSDSLTLKVWLRSELNKDNLSAYGKELVNQNKDVYDAIKVEFYVVKEEIGYAQSKPDAVAIWGDSGNFEIPEDTNNNRFVVEITKQYSTFSEKEYEIYNDYLEAVKNNNDPKAIAEKYEMGYEDFMVLMFNISLRFEK